MLILVAFIMVWALSPGPVAVMTLHETRKRGLMAGVAISGGATATSALMIVGAFLLHTGGIAFILESDSMQLVEKIGACGIILMGLYAGYRTFWPQDDDQAKTEVNSGTKLGFMQGMAVMATYIPQALIFYTLIVPQTVDPKLILTTILLLGVLKVTLIFGWHSAIALMATRAEVLVDSSRFGKALEVATAGLIVVLGVNIFF